MKNPKSLNEWHNLENSAINLKKNSLRAMFHHSTDRFNVFSREACGLLYDFSKQKINLEAFDQLISMAYSMELPNYIEKMFTGERINFTERRAVLHVALRNIDGEPIHFEGRDIMPDVKQALDKIKNFVCDIHSGAKTGYSGKKIDTIVNIGIGGSDLGPAMVCNALKAYAIENMRAFFVSNVDPNHIGETLKHINPETTLFVVASKTLTTQETLANANAAKDWFISKTGSTDISKHFIAVSTNKKAVAEFGIDANNMFVFWDWVGGRFSLWSSIGISIALYLGIENFYQLLDGAREMDKHFRLAPLELNLPVIMALIGVWNNNFLGYNSLAVIPYNQYLDLFPAYLQQGEMESNGKQADKDGNFVDYATSPNLWGQVGTNGQHAFFQMLHQGTQVIPIDFIAAIKSLNPIGDMQETLLANLLAQSEGLGIWQNRRRSSKRNESAGS